MQGNILGKSGTSKENSLFNLYQRQSAPSKDGLWIKTNEEIKDMVLKNEMTFTVSEMELEQPVHFRNLTYDKDNKVAYLVDGNSDVYSYDIIKKIYTKIYDYPGSSNYRYYVDICLFENCIYLFGADTSSSRNHAYKLDLQNKIWESIAKMPNSFMYGQCFLINEKIYLLKFSSNSTYEEYTDIYIYNTDSDNYTKVTDMPGRVNGEYYEKNVINFLDDIYIFDVIIDSQYFVYKYNTVENTFTQLTKQINGNFIDTALAVMDDKIYIFANYDKVYEYSIEANTISLLENVNTDTSEKRIILGFETNILIFNNPTNTKTSIFSLDLETSSDTGKVLGIYNNSLKFNTENKNRFLSEITGVYRKNESFCYKQEAYVPNTDRTEWVEIN